MFFKNGLNLKHVLLLGKYRRGTNWFKTSSKTNVNNRDYSKYNASTLDNSKLPPGNMLVRNNFEVGTKSSETETSPQQKSVEKSKEDDDYGGFKPSHISLNMDNISNWKFSEFLHG